MIPPTKGSRFHSSSYLDLPTLESCLSSGQQGNFLAIPTQGSNLMAPKGDATISLMTKPKRKSPNIVQAVTRYTRRMSNIALDMLLWRCSFSSWLPFPIFPITQTPKIVFLASLSALALFCFLFFSIIFSSALHWGGKKLLHTPQSSRKNEKAKKCDEEQNF